MGLGSVEFVTLAQARERAFELRRKLKDEKIDPLEQRRAGMIGARIAALKGATFEQVARQYVEQRSAQWRSNTTRQDWLSTLERYAFPVIGSLPVALIDTALVHRVLDPMWTAKPHVARRVRERLELVLEFARCAACARARIRPAGAATWNTACRRRKSRGRGIMRRCPIPSFPRL